MKIRSIVTIAWAFGMLLAPDNLILLGNIVGSMGAGSIFLIILAMLAFIVHSHCYKDVAGSRQGAAREFEWIIQTLNPAAAIIFSVAPRVLAAVFLATATLVASGFAFNEVFVRRIPSRYSITVILLTLVTALMMASGMAGTDKLDTYIRGSLILWLLKYAVMHLIPILSGVRRLPKISPSLSRSQAMFHGVIFTLINLIPG